MDREKAFYMIPHSWIMQCLEIYYMQKQVADLITRDLENWTVKLAAGGQTLEEVKKIFFF